MKGNTIRRRYAGPAIQKRERLATVAAQTSTSATTKSKGGCFSSKPDYQQPTLEKREKLSDVSGLATTVSGKIE